MCTICIPLSSRLPCRNVIVTLWEGKGTEQSAPNVAKAADQREDVRSRLGELERVPQNVEEHSASDKRSQSQRSSTAPNPATARPTAHLFSPPTSIKAFHPSILSSTAIATSTITSGEGMAPTSDDTRSTRFLRTQEARATSSHSVLKVAGTTARAWAAAMSAWEPLELESLP